MRKKTFASSARGKRRGKSAKHTPDSEIDFSDIPESSDLELAKARRVGRPSTGRAKQLIALRIDPAVLSKLRELAAQRHKPYQTMLHEMIESALTQDQLRVPAREDEEAFRLVFEKYAKPITDLIYDRVGDKELAEDLTQETFVRAYMTLESLQKETKLSTWLFGIARSVAGESLRARDERRVDRKSETGVAVRLGINSSADLVARASAGDQDAFRLIFERYSRPVTSFIYDQVSDRGLAEELTLETFVRAYRSLGSLREEVKLSTWLFGIAKNVARESLRARIRQNQQIDLDDQQVVDLGDRGPVPASQLLNKELNEVVQRALASLDEDKRLVFTLKVFQQCSYEEIAEITGFSISKSKSYFSRVRSYLRHQIPQHERAI